MYNRYRGSGGRPQRMEDNFSPTPKKNPAPKKPLPKPVQRPNTVMGSLSSLIPKRIGEGLTDLETEDLLLILILYLMYRESGDKELLLIMGAMYLL